MVMTGAYWVSVCICRCLDVLVCLFVFRLTGPASMLWLCSKKIVDLIGSLAMYPNAGR